MTVPDERMRAIRWGGELLLLLERDASLANPLRARAASLAHVYPARQLREALDRAACGLEPAWTSALLEAAALFADVDVGNHGSAEVRSHLRLTLRHFPAPSTISSMSWSPLTYWLAPDRCFDDEGDES
jgi:hypothetical protein